MSLGEIVVGLTGIVVGIVTALVSIIYYNMTTRQERHEVEDDKRFDRMTQMFSDRHQENQDALKKITRVLMMIVTAMVSNDSEAKRDLVSMIKELII